MKLPCGGCGKFVPGDQYTAGCFPCWSAKHSPKYRGYWEGAGKLPPLTPTEKPPSQVSYESGHNPYRDSPKRQAVHVPAAQPTPAATIADVKPVSTKCAHLGEENGQIGCRSCQGRVMVKTFTCAVHGQCSTIKKLDGIACCVGCKEHSALAQRGT